MPRMSDSDRLTHITGLLQSMRITDAGDEKFRSELVGEAKRILGMVDESKRMLLMELEAKSEFKKIYDLAVDASAETSLANLPKIRELLNRILEMPTDFRQ